jgi:hypothetical protein
VKPLAGQDLHHLGLRAEQPPPAALAGQGHLNHSRLHLGLADVKALAHDRDGSDPAPQRALRAFGGARSGVGFLDLASRLPREGATMRLTDRPRYFLTPSWLRLARLALTYSYLYDVYVPRLVGARRGPMVLPERRQRPDRRQRQVPIRRGDRRFMPWDRRQAAAA